MDSLSYKTQFLSHKNPGREWLVVDASHKELGRFSSRVAYLLRGKHKPGYTPHIACGDHVIIINAEKVRLTGMKLYQKEYLRHTGYPGGQRSRTPYTQMQKDPTRILEWAVKGMLPKNRLGRALFRNLHVYVGDTHPHEAQNPKPYDIQIGKS